MTRRESTDLRLWPGVVIVVLQWLITFGSGAVAPATAVQFFGMMGGPAGGLLLVLLWWGFASRAPKRDRILGPVLIVAFLAAAFALAHPSAFMVVFVYGFPAACMALVLWAALTRRAADGPRLVALGAMLLVACGIWTLVRTEGVDGNMGVLFAWRWQATAEERLLAAEADLEPMASAPAEPAKTGEDATGKDATSDDATSDDATSEDATQEDRAGEDAPAEDAVAAAAPPPASDDATTLTAPAEDATPIDTTALTVTLPEESDVAQEAGWPGFRGARREGVARNARIATDWEASPPDELWRRPVGPGWSSFAVVGDRLYTQEQRGEDEVVAAYDTATGEPVWRHRDAARFWEALAGAGPRATPTYDAGRLYSLGATGILNALDAGDGARFWRRDVAADTGAPIPEWGFSSSPLLSEGLVVIHTGGPEGKAVVAYDAVTGEPRWYAAAGALSYSSIQRARLSGIDQLLVLTGDGASSLNPSDGELLWAHDWFMPGGARIVQPTITPDGVLVGTGFGMGVRRIAVTRENGGWQIAERWTSKGLKPYYNDFILHRGYIYGFDGRILACLDLETGERAWKGGRYGNGQILLLSEQDLLLVLSDRGDVALVEAKPEGFSELAKMPAIRGKTWNHPVLTDGVLYVRNAEEMAAFRLPEG